jgi:radical SAM superfamily enzyme YgiQ (UPF0313 family)
MKPVPSDILLLNLPSPPLFDICRDWAGGFGIAWSRPKRQDYGQSDSPDLQACLPYLSSLFLKRRYDYKILDCQLLKLNKQQVLSAAKEHSPKIIISIIGLPSMKKDLELLRNIKETLPNAIIVGIGATCKAIPEQVLKLGGVDIALRSEFPYLSGLADVVETLLKQESVSDVLGISFLDENEIVNTGDLPSLDLSQIESPSYKNLQPADYHVFFTDLKGEKYEYVQILGSKGCPYGCFYCPYPVGYGNTVTFRSPKGIVDEIEFLNSTFKIRGFFFRDTSFTINKKHASDVCNEIKHRNLDIGWYTEARVNEVDKEILQTMKNVGCKRMSYGVETGNPATISKCKGGVDLNTIKNAFDLTKEAHILRTANVIVGWPEDDLNTLENTYRFVLSLKPDGVNCNTLVPYPGTDLREIALRDSLIVSDNFDELTPDDCVMKTYHLSAEQLCEEKKKMVRGFSKFQMRKSMLEVVTGKRRHLGMHEVKGVLSKYVSQGD